MDISQIKTRVLSLSASLDNFDNLQIIKAKEEELAWSIKEQLKFTNNQNEIDTQKLTKDLEIQLKKLENIAQLEESLKNKLLIGLGKK